MNTKVYVQFIIISGYLTLKSIYLSDHITLIIFYNIFLMFKQHTDHKIYIIVQD